jgi:hypothetical protein
MMGTIAFAQAGPTLAVTSTTAVALPSAGEVLLVSNVDGGAPAFVRLTADPADTATAADTPVPPSSQLLLNCPPTCTYLAVYSAGSVAVYATKGTATP